MEKKRRTNMLRSSLGGHYAGTGIFSEIYPEEQDREFYQNKAVHVRMPNDDKDKWEQLNGKISKYKLNKE
jgi:hypothetical protein